MSHYKTIYGAQLALHTDLYQLTMAQGYWKCGLADKEAVFHLFFRRNPFQGGYALTAGLACALDFLESFAFSSEDLDYLSSLEGVDQKPLFDQGFLAYLKDLKLQCDIDAMAEGSIAFPYEPMVRVTGPLIHAQLLESPLLNILNFPTLIATKAARVCMAAHGDSVMEFGLRRAQGFDGALSASRAAYIGGCTATSNVVAGKIYDIPVKGTHAHSWVQVFGSEQEAFSSYTACNSNNCVLLVDTFETLTGVLHAVEEGNKLKKAGKQLLGIRLDSGDLAYLSIQARKILDEAGLHTTQIIASNELDETVISELKQQGAKIDVWGVGTNLVTGKPHPALDGVYKLSAIRDPGAAWEYKIKISEQMRKTSNPGVLQVRRYYQEGQAVADAIYDVETQLQEPIRIVDPFDATRSRELGCKEMDHEDLLQPIMRKGELCYQQPSIAQIRQHAQDNLSKIHPGVKRFLNPHQYVVGMEEELYQMKIDLISAARRRESV